MARHIDIAPEVLARIGEGQLAYVREMTSEDLARAFPGGPELPPGLKLFALIGAAGEPIVVADDRDVALSSAAEHDLVAVSLH
ncbi:MAG: DUF1150 domain-containing protein [Hyphomicrobiales bacterium]|nr:DUF1150 domain-containing protein [Hyphomicrobiales bacterium]